mgnify:FL=1
MNTINSFSRIAVKDNQLVIETVIETSLDLIPLEGVAKVTAFGGNGSFMFSLDGKTYRSDLRKEYAIQGECLTNIEQGKTYAGAVDKNNKAYSIDKLVFEGVQPCGDEWSKSYISSIGNSNSY